MKQKHRSSKNVRREKKIEVTESSGNVFLDIGFPPGEAQKLLLQSELMIEIERMVKRRKLTRAKAAKLLALLSREFAIYCAAGMIASASTC